MANRSLSAASFRKCLARLTGHPGKRGNHVYTYRLAVVTSCGQDYGLRLSAGINAADAKADVGRLKRRLCLEANGVDPETVLNEWGPDDLCKYIKKKVSRDQIEERRGG